MIENIRKYTGLMIVVFVVLFISFFFLDSSALQNVGGGGAVLKINGRNYSEKEFRRLGSGSYELTASLAQSGDFGLYQFIMGLTGNAISQDDSIEKFFVGRMLLRNAQDEFGIHPGEEEISAYLRSLRAFAGPDGEFNSEQYRNFIEKGIGRLGLSESDLRELARDVLVSRKLTALVGTGLTADREAVAKTLALDNQLITADLARLDLTPFEEKIDPTEEEIKSYWELIQDQFTTEPKRKFTYILVAPKLPEEAAAEEPGEAETLAEAAASDEAKEAARKKKEEERAEKAAALAEERRKKQLELDGMVDDFTYELEQRKGTGFEELAAENQWEVKTTELIAASEAGEDFNLNLRASSRGGKAVDELFRLQVTADPLSKISQPIAVGENQWLVARLDEEEPSRAKTYAEARDEARAQYIAEKSAEAMKQAAEEAITKIKEAMAAGKSFAEAAKEAGIDNAKTVGPFNSAYRPEGDSEPATLFAAARNVTPGTIADVITESDRAFILHVAKREVVKEENAATRLDAEVANRTSENETIAFLSWMTARTEAAKVEQLYRR